MREIPVLQVLGPGASSSDGAIVERAAGTRHHRGNVGNSGIYRGKAWEIHGFSRKTMKKPHVFTQKGELSNNM